MKRYREQDRFTKRKNLSNYWINKAEAYHEAAISLYEGTRLNLDDPVMHLAGLSLEILSKAILVKQKQYFDEKKYSHHKIEVLISDAGIPLSDNQLATIRFFEEAIVWFSKYPGPKLKSKDQKSDSRIQSLWKKTGNDGMQIRALTPNSNRWPNKENYMAIWNKLMKVYFEMPTENPNEFGYQIERYRKFIV